MGDQKESTTKKKMPFSWLVYPGTVAAFFLGFYYLQEVLKYDHESANAICYFLSLAFLYWLERQYPYDAKWNDPEMDASIDALPGWQDLFHIFSLTFNYAVAQYLIVGIFQFLNYRSPIQGYIDSMHPIVAVIVSVHLGEVGYYFQHRFGHTFSFLWPFHAVHHQVLRVHVLNAGRIHICDQFLSNIFTFTLHYLAGFDDHMLTYVYGAYTICGMLSHSNIDMDTNLLNYVFNTPDTHRWHHSSSVSESNKNYGENLMYMDILCGTYFNPTAYSFFGALSGKEDQKPSTIHGYGRERYRDGAGILKGEKGRVFRLPKTFLGQLLAPFYDSPFRDHSALDCFLAHCEK